MGGLFCSKEERKPSEEPNKRESRKVEVNESELVIAKMKIQEDRLHARVKKLDRERDGIELKIKDLIKEKKKEEAYFQLKKIKQIKEAQHNAQLKLDFIQKQIDNVENTLDDVKFTSVIKESNRAIEKLNSEIDMEEIKIAKELQQEGKMRREELNELLEDDNEDNREIQDELNRIEMEMVDEQFRNNKVDTTNPQQIRPQVRQGETQQSNRREAMLS